jgi:hypothetical protein
MPMRISLASIVLRAEFWLVFGNQREPSGELKHQMPVGENRENLAGFATCTLWYNICAGKIAEIDRE